MKICTKNPGIRSLGLKVDDKKPKGWKDGDPIPQLNHSAEFDEHGNADVEDAAGRAFVAAYPVIKEGHNSKSAPPPEDED